MGFNIDTIHTLQEISIPQPDAQFGYTVTFLDENKIIVGAPMYSNGGRDNNNNNNNNNNINKNNNNNNNKIYFSYDWPNVI